MLVALEKITLLIAYARNIIGASKLSVNAVTLDQLTVTQPHIRHTFQTCLNFLCHITDMLASVGIQPR